MALPIDDLFSALARSSFRRRFHLGAKERTYLADKGIEVVLTHAAEFIGSRIAPAELANDGKQTPMRGHPVFIAQHATATCCRGCLEKWHKVPRGRALKPDEVAHVLAVIRRWLREECVDRQEGRARDPLKCG